MEIKLELDNEKTAKAVVTVTIIGLCRVAERLENHSLAYVNALAIIIIIATIYYPQRVELLPL